MKSNTSIVAVLVFAIVTIGSVGPLMADPDGSQNLRGLGGRTFEVMVTELWEGGGSFHNCYVFEDDGTFIDPLFPPGDSNWVQHRVGTSTNYTAVATSVIPDVLDLTLVQEGVITPAGGSGVLQLEASSYAMGTFLGDEIYLEFLSVGFQNDDCIWPE